jgi:hypothetical protein
MSLYVLHYSINKFKWIENLFVMGSLAELEIGPFARNIVGGPGEIYPYIK